TPARWLGEQIRRYRHRRAEQVRGPDGQRRLGRRIEGLAGEAQLLAHHHVRPALPVCGEVPDDSVEQFAGKSLAAVDGSDLVAFALRPFFDFIAFASDLALMELKFRACRNE